MYVYILRSLKDPEQKYIGLTNNLTQRLSQHNSGQSDHSDKYRPWKISLALWFEEKSKAVEFEKYLKSHSGRAFRSKHF